MNIPTKPLTLDSDVRHMGPDDVNSSVTNANISRALANRDVAIVTKVSELIADIKNTQILCPIILPRTSIQAFGTAWAGNFRIPVGYQASIFNAAVSSSPTAQKATLEVSHSAGTFGQNGSGSGVTQLVSTLTEYLANGDFVGEGELIFKITSSATIRLAVSASVTVILRPVI